jgi:hypothetical protein
MPLMSGSASGSFAKAMVFSTNKGRNIVRQLVTPANPNTPAQRLVRNKLAVAAAIMAVINRTTLIRTGSTVRDEVGLRNYAPSGQTWNATVSAEVIGPYGAKFTAAGTAYAAQTAADWQTAALALAVPYANLSLPNPSGMGTVSVTAGEQFFRHQYALYTTGVLTSAPTVPVAYA